jgi:hypothetical protein
MGTPDQPDADDVQFISEPIQPEAGTFATDMIGQGLASLPAAFTWRGRRYAIVECLEHVKQSSPEGHKAGGERYLRRQQFVVKLDSGQTATIYFQRQARPSARGRAAKQRWFLYTITGGQ